MLILGFPFINPILTAMAFPVMLFGAAIMAMSPNFGIPVGYWTFITGAFVFLLGLA